MLSMRSKKGGMFMVAIIAMMCVLSFSIIVAMVVMFFEFSSKGSYLNYEMNEYQYLVAPSDTALEEIVFGKISVPPQSFDDFLSFENEDGNNVIVSEFGLDEYRCTGTCFCDDDAFVRRMSGSVITHRSILAFLAASSSLIAYNIAQDWVTEECTAQFSDTVCAEESIHGVVDDCVSMANSEEENYDKENVLEADEEECRSFECSGFCVEEFHASRRSLFENRLSASKRRGIRCADHKVQSDVTVRGRRNRKGMTDENTNKDYVVLAQLRFQEQVLDPFCRQVSKSGGDLHNSRKSRCGGDGRGDRQSQGGGGGGSGGRGRKGGGRGGGAGNCSGGRGGKGNGENVKCRRKPKSGGCLRKRDRNRASGGKGKSGGGNRKEG